MRNPLTTRLFVVLALLGITSTCMLLGGCGSTTTYNITFEQGAFRVSDRLTVEPGQGGDDSGGPNGTAAGGTESSPGGSNVIDGFANQGNIFQIGTSAKPTTTATTDAAVDATLTP